MRERVVTAYIIWWGDDGGGDIITRDSVNTEDFENRKDAGQPIDYWLDEFGVVVKFKLNKDEGPEKRRFKSV